MRAIARRQLPAAAADHPRAKQGVNFNRFEAL
jgi:hypothetical protein